MQVAATDDAIMKQISHGEAYVLWQTFSNELSSPRILVCPQDKLHTAATNFTIGFSDANISYFLNLDANQDDPQTIVVGDDNLIVNGKPIHSGILNLATNAVVEWTKARMGRDHGPGNIALSDGSVQQVTVAGLQGAVESGNLATNRWVIP